MQPRRSCLSAMRSASRASPSLRRSGSVACFGSRVSPLAMWLTATREAPGYERLKLSDACLEPLEIRHPVRCRKSKGERRIAVREAEVCGGKGLDLTSDRLPVFGHNGSALGILHALLLRSRC